MTPYIYPGLQKVKIEDEVTDFLEENFHLLNFKDDVAYNRNYRKLKEYSILDKQRYKVFSVGRALVVYLLKQRGYKWREIAEYIQTKHRTTPYTMLNSLKNEHDLMQAFRQKFEINP